MTVTYTPLNKSHYPALIDIVKEVWHFDDFASPKVAKRLATSFFMSCLADYTDSAVALLDNQPVGVILMKNDAIYRPKLRDKYQAALAQVPLQFNKEGRLHSSVYRYVETIDAQLINMAKNTYDGQLTLFAVSEKAQGHGIGKALFQLALSTFKKQQINNFYLYTDTTCNYGFYDHQGMTVAAKKKHHFTELANTPPTTFFLYEGKID